MLVRRVRLKLVRDRRYETVMVSSPEDAARLLQREIRGRDRECLWRIDLDARNQVTSYELVSMGTVDAALVHPREIWKGALLSNASSVIVVHNHPSGLADPSREDREATRRLVSAGKLLGVPLADHVIVADRGLYSFRAQGLIES